MLLATGSFWLQSYGSLMPWHAAKRFHGGLYRVIGASALLSSVSIAAFLLAPPDALRLPALFVAAMGTMLAALATITAVHRCVGH